MNLIIIGPGAEALAAAIARAMEMEAALIQGEAQEARGWMFLDDYLMPIRRRAVAECWVKPTSPQQPEEVRRPENWRVPGRHGRPKLHYRKMMHCNRREEL